MPIRAPKVCGWCGGVHPYGFKCEKAKARDSERKAAFDKKRPNSTQRGYDRDWEAAARAFLQRPENKWCASCGSPAVVVMHRRSIRTAPHLRLEPSNWLPGCARCNAKDAAKERQNRK